NDTYWEMRYTLKRQNLPSFLAKDSEKILTTGKYLNVIRECGLKINSTVSRRLSFILNERGYQVRSHLSLFPQHPPQEIIEEAYKFASKKLLALLIEEKQLIPLLKSIKHYFLLDQGDFFVHFMDSAGE